MTTAKPATNPQVGAIRLVPYCQTDRYPTRCAAERYEYSDCYGRKIWRSIGTYDSEASARVATGTSLPPLPLWPSSR